MRVWDDITSKSPSGSENVMAFEEMLARNMPNHEQWLSLGGKLTAVLIFFKWPYAMVNKLNLKLACLGLNSDSITYQQGNHGGKFLKGSEPQCLHLLNGINNSTHFIEL